MNLFFRKHWPLFCAMGLYWGAVLLLVIFSLNKNQGHLIYPLDDTYIHMAMAKNVTLQHVWGVTRYEFTSATSSPLWTSLLALAYLACGVSDVTPLILNLLFGTLTVLFAYFFLARYVGNRLRIFILLLFAEFVTPLPSLTVVGMEHVLHALLSLCFVYLAIQVLSAAARQVSRQLVLLLVLSPFVTTIRYEGMFLVFVVCLLLLLRKRVFHAVALGITALSSVLIYGLWSISHGWYFFPNSVVLKGQIPEFTVKGMFKLAGFHALRNISENGHILLLLVAALLLLLFRYRRNGSSFDRITVANLIFVGTVLLHMQFAAPGWFYRYEAYLVLLGVVVVGMAGNDLRSEPWAWKISKQTLPQHAVAMLLILVVASPYGLRALLSFLDTPQATNNIYEQQYRMGTFLKRFYQGRTIAVNDIGAVSYLADVRLLDLFGLASMESARWKRQKKFTIGQLNLIAQERQVAIAMVYDEWFARLPRHWARVAQWKIVNNKVCGSDTVSLYAVAAHERDALIRNLNQFSR